MRYAIINEHKMVVHIMECDPNSLPHLDGYHFHPLPEGVVDVGDTFDGKKFIPQPVKPPMAFRT